MDELTHTARPSRDGRRLPECKAAALWALVVLFAAPAHCEDLIAQWLQQDGTGVRRRSRGQDLNAVTDAQWKTLFRFGREDPDSDLGRQLLMRVNEEAHQPSLHLDRGFPCGLWCCDRRNQSQGLHTPRSEKSDGAGSTDRAGISGNAWIAVTANLGCAPLRARAANRRLL